MTLGGAVTLAIIVTATPLLGRGIEQADALMVTGVLEPILGSAAKTFFGLGLFAAGLTSAITAPLAAAYATTGALGMDRDMRSTAFRSVWILVIVVGVALSLSGGSPTEAILLAQAANGLLLPLIAIFLLVVVNDRSLLGRHRNRWFANLLAGAVVLVVIGLGAFQLLRVSRRRLSCFRVILAAVLAQIACIRAVVRKKEVANSLRQNREGDAREIDLEASLMSELSSCPVPKLGPF